MNPRRDTVSNRLEIQALYSIPALAQIANVTRHLMLRVLRANGIHLVHGGRSVFVPLSEIEEKIAPLWQSLCAAERARRSADEPPPS